MRIKNIVWVLIGLFCFNSPLGHSQGNTPKVTPGLFCAFANGVKYPKFSDFRNASMVVTLISKGKASLEIWPADSMRKKPKLYGVGLISERMGKITGTWAGGNTWISVDPVKGRKDLFAGKAVLERYYEYLILCQKR